MFTAQQIKQHMNVVDTQGRHIGNVDHIQDSVIGLIRDGFSDDLHHFVSLAAVMKIDGDTVVVEPGQATTIEAVAGAIEYSRANASTAQRSDAIFGASGLGDVIQGAGIGD